MSTESSRVVTKTPEEIAAGTISVPDIDSALATLGERIAHRRKILGLSLADLAERSGTTKSHVWEIEQGRSKSPTIRMAWQLAYALGWSLSELIGVCEHTELLDPAAMRIAVQIDGVLRARARAHLQSNGDEGGR